MELSEEMGLLPEDGIPILLRLENEGWVTSRYKGLQKMLAYAWPGDTIMVLNPRPDRPQPPRGPPPEAALFPVRESLECTTGVPLPFTVEFEAETSFPEQVEAAAHAMVAPYQVSADREFFRVPPRLAIDAVRDAPLDASSIDAWRSDEMHQVRQVDRLTLTTSAGDIFRRPCLFGPARYPHAVPVDLRQAHADGDLLELMGAADPAHTAASRWRHQGEHRPVPFLDREQENSVPRASPGCSQRCPGCRIAVAKCCS